MSDTTLRDKVTIIVGNVASSIKDLAKDEQFDLDEYIARGNLDRVGEYAAGSILAMIREAMLGPETLDAVAKVWDEVMADPNANGGDLMVETLTAALDAAGIGEPS
jgi:hypothetical protein